MGIDRKIFVGKEQDNSSLVDSLDSFFDLMQGVNVDMNDQDLLSGLLITNAILEYPVLNKEYTHKMKIKRPDKIDIMHNIIKHFDNFLYVSSSFFDKEPEFSEQADFIKQIHESLSATFNDYLKYVLHENSSKYLLFRNNRLISPTSKKGHKDLVALFAFYFKRFEQKSKEDSYEKAKYFIENLVYDYPIRINRRLHVLFEIKALADSSTDKRLAFEYDFLCNHAADVFNETKRYFRLK